jgi:hypothetical protein
MRGVRAIVGARWLALIVVALLAAPALAWVALELWYVYLNVSGGR